MNYYGINRKMPVQNKYWEGPRARLVNKEKAAEKERWLDEIITIVKTFRTTTLEGEHTVTRAYEHYRKKYPTIKVYTERSAFAVSVVLVGPRRVLADEK